MWSLSSSNITKGLYRPSLLYMQSSDYWIGYKLCYFLNLTKNCSVVERWFEWPTITELERENCALDSARVQLVPTFRWWAIKAVFIWSCLGPRVDWILVSIPITILYLIVYAKYFDECLCCLFALAWAAGMPSISTVWHCSPLRLRLVIVLSLWSAWVNLLCFCCQPSQIG